MTMIITSDEAHRIITICNTDGELNEGDAKELAVSELKTYIDGEHWWSFVECERVAYDRIKVRFQLL